MSKDTKGFVENVKNYLANAGLDVFNAERNAKLIGDKVLVEKVLQVKKSIDDVQSHIKSKTGVNG